MSDSFEYSIMNANRKQKLIAVGIGAVITRPVVGIGISLLFFAMLIATGGSGATLG